MKEQAFNSVASLGVLERDVENLDPKLVLRLHAGGAA